MTSGTTGPLGGTRYAVVILEGAAGTPERPGPLSRVETPVLDALADGGSGRVGMVSLMGNERAALPEVAMGVALGARAGDVPGRGVLEALGLAEDVGGVPWRWAFAVSLVSASEGRVLSPGVAVTDAEARVLLGELAAAYAVDGWTLHATPDTTAGVAVLLDAGERDWSECVTTDPWSLLVGEGGAGIDLRHALPMGGEHADALVGLVAASQHAWAGHEINATRRELGKPPVTHAWPWGGGARPACKAASPATLVTGRRWAAGLARWWGAEPCVAGPAGMVDAAVAALPESDLTVLHLDGCAAAALAGDPDGADRAMAAADDAVGAVAGALRATGDAARLLVVATATVAGGRYTAVPTPALMHGHRVRAAVPRSFTEADAAASDLRVERGHELFEYFLRS